MTKTYEPFKDKKLEESRKTLRAQLERMKARGIKINYKYYKSKK